MDDTELVESELPRDHRPVGHLTNKLRRFGARYLARRPCPVRPGPLVSFSFDDVPHSAVLTAAPLLESRGVRGTWYVASGMFGKRNHLGRMLSEPDVVRLLKGEHEIGCHTATHLNCAEASRRLIGQEMALNHANLSALGAPPRTFAYPFGQAGLMAKLEASTRFPLARGVRDGLVDQGSDLAEAPSVALDGRDAEAIGKHWIDKAVDQQAWLILFTHDVADQHSPYGTTERIMAVLLDYAIARGLEPVTVEEGARRVGFDKPLRP